eukprot:TRINITY_DN15879_c0_g1_i1.p1 TRINITY_DN15879_c0_g1~~TRINITY_DN15879_c0_g1_i1.p1  ORF type:complete len:397 (-),score=14.71 TRINITY_DN15879_c0_g1_i1:63-1253(-)
MPEASAASDVLLTGISNPNSSHPIHVQSLSSEATQLDSLNAVAPATSPRPLLNRTNSQKNVWETVKGAYHLRDFHALPEYLRDNEFILKGYRSNWTLKSAFLSVFRIHNETGNIWTHLLGFLLFLGLTVYTATHLPQRVIELPSALPPGIPLLASFQASLPTLHLPKLLSQQRMRDDVFQLIRPLMHIPSANQPITRWPFFVFLSGAMICLLSSSLCHLLGYKSREFNNFLWRFDYAGIAILIAASFYPCVYYTFLCDPIPRFVYLFAITLMGIATTVISLLDRFQHPSYRNFRAGLFFTMGLSGIVPITHKLIFYYGEPVILETTMLEILMGVFFGLGALFYASRVPERWLPGKFDVAGHSHQLFHVLVVLGALTQYYTGLVYIGWRDKVGCSVV